MNDYCIFVDKGKDIYILLLIFVLYIYVYNRFDVFVLLEIFGEVLFWGYLGFE